jgi:hypothetical protein
MLLAMLVGNKILFISCDSGGVHQQAIVNEVG